MATTALPTLDDLTDISSIKDHQRWLTHPIFSEAMSPEVKAELCSLKFPPQTQTPTQQEEQVITASFSGILDHIESFREIRYTDYLSARTQLPPSRVQLSEFGRNPWTNTGAMLPTERKMRLHLALWQVASAKQTSKQSGYKESMRGWDQWLQEPHIEQVSLALPPALPAPASSASSSMPPPPRPSPGRSSRDPSTSRASSNTEEPTTLSPRQQRRRYWYRSKQQLTGNSYRRADSHRPGDSR